MATSDQPLAGVRLLYIVNVDWFLVSHRLPLVRAAIEAGADVTVACTDTGSMAPIEALGAHVVALPLSRSGTGPLGEVRSLAAIARLVVRTKPHIVHNVTIKPVMYGTLVTRLLRRRTRVVNAVSGFGYAVEGDAHRLLSSLVLIAYRLLFRSRRVEMIVQNDGAAQWLLRHRCTTARHIHVIEGSGVDCSRFTPAVDATEPHHAPTVLLASRMLRDKGVGEFAEAAALLRPEHPDVEFVLAGSTDVGGNPTSYTDDEMRQLTATHPLRWTGHVADMPALLRSADVFVLPSYHEGLPKALIEAAATGLPLVATDIDGCRPVVTPGVNGELVPVGDAAALAAAIGRILDDADLRRRYGEAGRRIAVERFAIEHVLDATLRLYSPFADHESRP